MIAAVALLVALGCAAASAARLWFAAHPTALHPELFLREVEASPGWPKLDAIERAIANEPSADWERDLFAALRERSPEARSALVNEQLTELDYRIQRWSRVPRVCASLSTSGTLMLATLVLRRGVADAGEIPSDIGELVTHGFIGDAITVACLGFVATGFAIAAQGHAKRIARKRMEAADKLIGRLEAIAETTTPT